MSRTSHAANSDRAVQFQAVRVLGVFTLIAGVTQMLWLNFAPLIAFIQKRYAVSELQASTLVLVFPLLYVVLSIPAGWLIDRKGYRFAVGWGATITALFATVRIWETSFAGLLIGQIGIAVAQPLVINAISKLVSDWFPEEHGAIATGVCTMGMFIGMAVAMAWTPSLVFGSSLRTAMIVFAGISWLSAALFWGFGREHTRTNPQTRTAAPLSGLLRNRQLWIVFVLAFLGLGFFNGLTTWLEQILGENGLDAESAGMVGGVLIIGGIVGSIAIPALSDKLRKRKPPLVGCAALALPLVYPLCTSRSYALVLTLGALLGFVLLPAFALLLEMSSELSGPALAGNANGLLMLMGNAGGTIIILAMQLVRADSPSYVRAVWLLIAVLVATLALALTVHETYGAEHNIE